MNIKSIVERKRILGIASAILVFAVIFLLGNKPSLYLIEEQKLQSSPDYFLEGVHSKTFSKQGIVVEEVTASSATHFNDSKTTLMTTPVIKRTQDGILSTASAANGTINDKSNNYRLDGDASVKRLDRNNQLVEINAYTIIYDDASQLITGEQDASLKNSQISTQSENLTYHITNQTILLEGDVVSKYDPSKK